MERLIFDLDSLLKGPFVEKDDFISEKFRSRFPESTSRFTHTYPFGRKIEVAEDPRKLDKYCIPVNVPKNERVSFRDRIKAALLDQEEPNNTFWVHTNYENAYHYYTNTIIEYVKRHYGYKRAYPKVVIAGQTTEQIKKTCTDLFKSKSSDNKKSRVAVKLVDPENQQNCDESEEERSHRRCDVVVGTPINIFNDLKYRKEKQSSGHQHYVSLIVIENCESLKTDETYLQSVIRLLEGYNGKFTRVMFFCLSTKMKQDFSPVFRICNALTRGNLIVEMEALREHEIFDYIRVHQVTQCDEFYDGLVAMQTVQEENCDIDQISICKIAMSEAMQKIDKCFKIINKLMEIRQVINERRHQFRNEKILVVTENPDKANFLALSLKDRDSSLKISTLTRHDDLDTAESVNFSFRSDEINICVVDWRSIHDINRGIVDSIIFVDLMDPNVCKTILEDEMERLITRDAVRLKVHVILDLKKDIWIIRKLTNLINKHNLQFPSNIEFLNQKYDSWVAKLNKGS